MTAEKFSKTSEGKKILKKNCGDSFMLKGFDWVLNEGYEAGRKAGKPFIEGYNEGFEDGSQYARQEALKEIEEIWKRFITPDPVISTVGKRKCPLGDEKHLPSGRDCPKGDGEK